MARVNWALPLALLMIFNPSCVSGSSQPVKASYQSKVRFEKDRIIEFPEVRLAFKGTRKVEVKTPQGRPIPFAPYFDFEVSDSKLSKTISWSAGTGAIGPATFHASGKCFSLELKYADQIGKLADDELVLKEAPADWCQNDK